MWVLSRGTKRMDTLRMSSHPNGVSRLDFFDPCCGSFFLASWSLIASCLFLKLVLQSSLNPVAPYILLLNSLWFMLARGVSVAHNQRILVDTTAPMHCGYWPSVQFTRCLSRPSMCPDSREHIFHGGIWGRGLTQEQWHFPRLPLLCSLLHILIFFLGFPDMLECSVSFSLHSMSCS